MDKARGSVVNAEDRAKVLDIADSSSDSPNANTYTGASRSNLRSAAAGSSSTTVAQPSVKIATAGAKATTQQPLRKSCEFCRLRKKKCDGDGANRCSLCVSRGNAECVYRGRISSAPKNPARSSRGNKGAKGKASEGRPGNDDSLRAPDLLPRAGSSLMPMKRCRLSASPATGLVGMQENMFLSDFFDCMGFLDLISERDVRKAMVSVMLAAVPPSEKERLSTARRLPRITGDRACAIVGDTGNVALPAQRADAARCSLWCVIALGALLQGWPPSTVMRYLELARESLMTCFDDVSLETLRAYTLMAFLHNFLGDTRKFEKYLLFAHGTARALPPEDLSTETVDLLRAGDSAKLYSGMAPTVGELESFCQLDDAANASADRINCKADLRRLIFRTGHRFDQAFFKDMSDGGIITGKTERVEPELISSGHGMGFTGPSKSAGRDLGPDHGRVALIVDGEEPPPPGDTTRRLAEEDLSGLQRVQEDGARADTTEGVGGFLYQMRFAFAHYMRHMKAPGNEAIGRAMLILERYPGLSRFSSWLHLTHCAVVSCALAGFTDRYERLRQAYNSVRPTGMPPVPPIEEFRGMGDICGHVYCRSCFSPLWADDPEHVEALRAGSAWDIPGLPKEPAAGASGSPPVTVVPDSSRSGPDNFPNDAARSTLRPEEKLTSRGDVPRIVPHDSDSREEMTSRPPRGCFSLSGCVDAESSGGISDGCGPMHGSTTSEASGPSDRGVRRAGVSTSLWSAQQQQSLSSRRRQESSDHTRKDFAGAGSDEWMRRSADKRRLEDTEWALRAGGEPQLTPLDIRTTRVEEPLDGVESVLLREALFGDRSEEEDMWAADAEVLMSFDPDS